MLVDNRLVVMKKPLPTLAGLFFMTTMATLPTRSTAQDTHYWTHQYGTRSTLLGGAVIGSVIDLSATYYNPGALALIQDPELFLGAKIFDFTTVTVDNSLEEDTKLNSEDLKRAPSFFGGLLPFGFLGEHRLGYSFFTRQQFSVRVEGARAGTFDAIPRRPVSRVSWAPPCSMKASARRGLG